MAAHFFRHCQNLEPCLANCNSSDGIAFNVGHHEGKGDKLGTIMVTTAFCDDSNCNTAEINASRENT